MVDKIESGEITFNTFCYMYTGAKQMFKQANECEQGKLYYIISSITYCAFTLEAYFNHLGNERNSEWHAIERKISKIEKFKLFCNSLGIEFDLSKRPYKTMVDVFSYRDKMAHGKTTTDVINESVEGDVDDLNSFAVGPDWFLYSTIENAEVAIFDTKNIVTELHKAAGITIDPFLVASSGIYSINTQQK